MLLIVGRSTKTWAVDYRNFAGKRRLHSLGRWPGMSLAAARKAAQAQRALVAEGNDPQGERAAYRAAETVGQALDRFLALHVAGQRTANELDGGSRSISAP